MPTASRAPVTRRTLLRQTAAWTVGALPWLGAGIPRAARPHAALAADPPPPFLTEASQGIAHYIAGVRGLAAADPGAVDHFAQARRHFQVAIEHHPQYHTARVALAAVCWAEGAAAAQAAGATLHADPARTARLLHAWTAAAHGDRPAPAAVG